MVVEDRPEGTLYEAAGAVLLAIPFYLLIKAVTAAIPLYFGPAGLPLLTLFLVLVIHLLSTGRGAAISSSKAHFGGSPDAIYRFAGAPVGITLLLLLLLFPLYIRTSLFGSDDN